MVVIPLMPLPLPPPFLQQVALKEGGPAVKNFADSAAPTFDYFYFFHLTNPTDVQKSAAKPVLREIGPIVYK